MYTSLYFSSKIIARKGPLSHKQGSLINQFGVWLGRDLEIKLLLLLNVKLILHVKLLINYDLSSL
jgi:hypothetical protein